MASENDIQYKGQDYRRTKVYQIILLRCTGAKKFGYYFNNNIFDPEIFPNRQFFSVYREQYGNDQYYTASDSDVKVFYSKMPLSKF